MKNHNDPATSAVIDSAKNDFKFYSDDEDSADD